MTLEARDIEFAYFKNPVLRHISQTFMDRTLVCLVGPNGSGKSTLIRCLDGIIRPKRGSVLLDGAPVHGLRARSRARRIGYVPQNGAQHLPAKVHDVVMMGRKPYLSFRVSGNDRRVVAEALALLGVTHLKDCFYDELSGGERQKVLLARAVAQATPVLLLDEPTSNLDLRHQLEVMRMLRRLVRERSVTVIVAIHDLNTAVRFADHAVLMKTGRIVAAGPPGEVLIPENIAAVYGVTARIMLDQTGATMIYPEAPIPATSETGPAGPAAGLQAARPPEGGLLP